ncbi:MAG: ATP-binding protein [Bacteroidota bacterium]
MSIRKHILSALIFVLALTLISFGTSIYYLSKIGSTSTQILQEDYQAVKAAEEIIVSLAKIDRMLVMICLDSTSVSEEASLLKIIESEQKIISNYLSTIQQNIEGEKVQKLYNQLKESYTKYEQTLDQIPTTKDRDQLYLTLLSWQNEVLLSNGTNIVEAHHMLLKEKDQELQSLYLKAKVNTFLASILVLLVVGVALDKIPNWIMSPIRELTEKMKRLVHSESREAEENIQITTDRDLKELEKFINIAGKRIRESEEKILLITENLYDIIFFSKPNGEVFYTTPSVQRVVGYTPEEVIGTSVYDLLHSEDVEQTMSGTELKANAEIRIKKKRGKYLWLEVNQTLHRGKDGEVLYAQYTARDISKRKRAEERTRKTLIKEKALNDQLMQANHELDQFVYSASHNLRSPLTSIMGLISLLKLARQRGERDELIEKVGESVFKLDETIKEIIDYSRNGRTALEIGLVDFEEITVETIRSLQYLQSGEKPVDICYQIDSEVKCYSDSNRLKMIFVNLASNAIKYYDSDKAAPSLQILITNEKDKTSITFADNGVGIKEEQKDRIFDMFYRASEQSYGAGLGLYITKSTVAKLNGELSVESTPQEGTRITVTIPNLDTVRSKVIHRDNLISFPEAQETENQ